MTRPIGPSAHRFCRRPAKLSRVASQHGAKRKGSSMAVVAVQPDDQLLTSGRTQSFSNRWIARIPELGHQVRVGVFFPPRPLGELVKCNGVMWWFPPMPFPRNFGRRLMMALNHAR